MQPTIEYRPSPMDADEFSRRLKVARTWGGYSQSELGAALRDYGSFSRGLVGQWEQGRATPPIKIIEAIAEICGVRAELLTDEAFDPLSVGTDSARSSEHQPSGQGTPPQGRNLDKTMKALRETAAARRAKDSQRRKGH